MFKLSFSYELHIYIYTIMENNL